MGVRGNSAISGLGRIKLAPANNWSVVAMNTESYYNGRHGTSVHSYMPYF